MTQAYRPRIDRVTRHIRDNLAGDLSLDTLADIAAFSRFHFARIFQAMTGETVADAVRRARLNRAAVLLATTGLPMASIAATCGYPRQDSFRRGVLTMYDVTIRALDGFTFAGLVHAGPYPGISDTFGRLGPALGQAGLGPVARQGIGVYYHMPGQVPDADLRAHAGCIVPDDANVPAPLEKIAMPGGRMAVLTLKGPYAGIPDAWTYLYGTWLPGSGEEAADRVPFELYPNSPMDTAPADLITEICVPLK
jgi:AraC family transcriptional regulator